MKRFIILAAALLCAVATNAQQLKTAQGITIETYEPKPEPKPKKPKKTLSPTERGFEQSVEMGASPILDDDEVFLNLEYIAGYRFNNYLFLGGGTGVELLLKHNSLAIPIYANARLYLLPKSRWQPFISLSLGAIVPIVASGIEYHNGIQPHINPTVGVNYRINSKYSCYLNLGYMPRWTIHEYRSSDIYYYGYDYNCFTIRLGFTF